MGIPHRLPLYRVPKEPTMEYVPLTKIEVRKRQRKTIAAAPLNELKESILTTGLLHPPVAWHDLVNDKWVLVVGERRFTALQRIHDEKRTFIHGGIEFFRGEANIPVTPLGDYLDEVGRFEAELAENVYREDLPWTDRMEAYAELHKMRQLGNPKQTFKATGEELVNRGAFKPPTNPESTSTAAAQIVSQAVILSEHLNNDKVRNARNPSEALQIVYKLQEERALAALAKRGLALAKAPPQIEIRHGDLTILLPNLDPARFDLVCADPPYGQGASAAGYRSRGMVHHNYRDDEATAKDLARCIITEGFRITKPRANLLVFCNILLFDWLKGVAANMGWVPFERPLIWQKSHSEGMAPWGGSGPRITTEFMMFATKGQRGMNASPTDVFDFPRVSRNERSHGAEKPVDLMKALLQCLTLPGEAVCDPCCGSGSTLVAAKECGRTGLGIETDLDYHTTAMANVFGDLADAK